MFIILMDISDQIAFAHIRLQVGQSYADLKKKVTSAHKGLHTPHAYE